MSPACVKHDEDLALLGAVLAGRPRAWTDFCKRFERVIAGAVRQALGRYLFSYSDQDVEDAIADVYLVLLENDRAKLRQYDPSRQYKLTSWISMIAGQRTLQTLRRRQPEYLPIDEAQTLRLEDPTPNPHDALEHKERRERIVAKAKTLSKSDRELLLETPEELAQKTNTPIGTIYTRRLRLLDSLLSA